MFDTFNVDIVTPYAKNASPPTPNPPVIVNAPDDELIELVVEVIAVSLLIVPPLNVEVILATAVEIKLGTNVVSIV